MLDIGANLGRFSVPFHVIFPDTEITMIEPNPYCVPILEKTRHKLLVAALGNKVEERAFYTSKLDPLTSGASFYKEKNPTTDHFDDHNLLIQTIKTVRLDDLVGNEAFSFIKMDIQGSEVEALEGGEQTFMRADFALIECGMADYNPGSPDIESVIHKMRDLGYDMFDALEFHRSSDLYNNCIFQIDILFKNQRYSA
jgi:FkbM family methyltransferase